MDFRTLLRTAAAVLAAANLWALDPALARLAGSDAAVVSGIDFQAIHGTPFGKFLLDKISDADSRFDRVFQLTGFDPSRDLHEILIVAEQIGGEPGARLPATPVPGSGLVAVKGKFDESAWTSLVARHGAVAEYKGRKLLSDGTSDSAVAFLDGVFVAASQERLRGLIDAAPERDAVLAGRLEALSAENHVWFFANGSPARLAEALPNSSRNMRSALSGSVMQSILDMSFGMRFGEQVTIAGEARTRTDEDARALAGVGKFFAEMAKSNGGAPGGLGSLLLSLNLRADGARLRFTMSAPERDIERLFESGRARIRAAGYRESQRGQ
ncbi:MAG: hypothetical protein R2729_15895 [Bryobacteraceae bacterium]